MTTRPLIVYAGGFWGTNIGNAFFDLGCIHALKTACPDADVRFTLEQPANYWEVKGGNPENALDYLGAIEADYLVIAGPMISPSFPAYWQRTLDKTMKRGTRLILLSAGCNHYSDNERNIARAFIKKYQPYALVSRDEYTYENFKDLASKSYNGICCAFFSNDYFKPYKVNLDPYVVFNFDSSYEPLFQPAQGKGGFEMFGSKWEYKLKARSRYMEAVSHGIGTASLRKGRCLDKYGGFNIIRTNHCPHPSRKGSLYSAPNTFVSDVPFDYLNIYAHAEAVFSDRVHACVPGLAFNRPTMLFNQTLRGRIFSRLGLGDICKRPVLLEPAYLASEKKNLLSFMTGLFSGK